MFRWRGGGVGITRNKFYTLQPTSRPCPFKFKVAPLCDVLSHVYKKYFALKKESYNKLAFEYTHFCYSPKFSNYPSIVNCWPIVSSNCLV